MSFPSDFAIIDPHIHLWDVRNTPRLITPIAKRFYDRRKFYHWLLTKVSPKNLRQFVGRSEYVAEDYLPLQYRDDVAGISVSHVVHVQANWHDFSLLGSVGETRWLEDIFSAKNNKSNIQLGAVVGHVDMTREDAEPVIAAHQQASNKFVGIRHMLAWSSDKNVLNYAKKESESSSASFRRNFELLEKNNLSFDAWGYHTQLDEINELAKSFPNTQIILCHMGTPIGLMGEFASFGKTAMARYHILEQWQEGIAKVAENKNVVVKLSGMFMPVLGWGLHENNRLKRGDYIQDQLIQLIAYVIEQFSVDRCMFASNFPMDKVSLSFEELFELYWKVVESHSLEEKHKLFFGNAKRVYKM